MNVARSVLPLHAAKINVAGFVWVSYSPYLSLRLLKDYRR